MTKLSDGAGPLRSISLIKMNKVILKVKVQPKAKKVGVEKIGEDSYKVRVHAAPEKGAANKEVIAALAEYFDVPPSTVKIVRGQTSHNKVIEIGGTSPPPKSCRTL